MILIVAATLFVSNLLQPSAVDRGFESDGLLVVNVRSSSPYPPQRALEVQRTLLERMRAEPGVRSASASQTLPVGGNLWDRIVAVEGLALPPEVVAIIATAPDYFATLGTPLLTGREFGDRDSAVSMPVAIVNDSFARHFFGSGPVIGRRVTSVNVTYEIVGVVGDAKYQDLRDPIRRTMYVAWTQREGEQPGNYSYLVRAAVGDPVRLAPAMNRLVRTNRPAQARVEAATAKTRGSVGVTPNRIRLARPGWLPALRASRVDPLVAIRHE